MKIKLLKKGYKNSVKFYEDFLNDQIESNEEYFSGEVVYIDEAPDFPIYLNTTKGENERFKIYKQAFDVISKYYIKTDRDIHFNEIFWHSLFCVNKREYLLNQYLQIKESHKNFKNIVIKKFDWENYVYKCVLAAEYITDNVECQEEKNKYFRLIVKNLDLYNYIIKYEIFRNDKFLINILDIVNDNNLSKILKSKIKNKDDLGKDERVGRRIIFEFNKSYPVVISPTIEKEELEKLFMEYLNKYL
ncbi:hypothetical protein OW763_01330 [Clostridium aestuarii]|uniref:Uncharacterized protein n=1 Tax=Clostridium aestuarii TaxID=338193 RepID=A0ABT4CVJ4_9CLOT|nr:hypothetical protein [Clostridium aestuarii]MCY6482994.1 hypothetical protein [Clostridium aestuarii]